MVESSPHRFVFSIRHTACWSRCLDGPPAQTVLSNTPRTCVSSRWSLPPSKRDVSNFIRLNILFSIFLVFVSPLFRYAFKARVVSAVKERTEQLVFFFISLDCFCLILYKLYFYFSPCWYVYNNRVGEHQRKCLQNGKRCLSF